MMTRNVLPWARERAGVSGSTSDSDAGVRVLVIVVSSLYLLWPVPHPSERDRGECRHRCMLRKPLTALTTFSCDGGRCVAPGEHGADG